MKSDLMTLAMYLVPYIALAIYTGHIKKIEFLESEQWVSWHKDEKFSVEFPYYMGDTKGSSVCKVSAPMKVRNFKEIFTGEPGPLKCSDCNGFLKKVPLALSISFSGKVLHATGKYCPHCDNKPGAMHVTVTIGECIAMLK